ncbi:MAG: hypothetical protein B6D58_05995 [candidate division Zixibacteria bacterium 4484_95]|nr:MAG: hypothetical protein B6D58_05995 [candidate division Zixibacteria bacterium 4484_95]
MSKAKLLALLIFLSAVIIGCGKKPEGEVTKKVLKNGLTVLVKEDHKVPVVSIVTWVKAGYFNEPDSLTGISHLLEHMFFKGTQKRGVGELARETKAAGGYLNAGTIYEHTCYYTVLPSESFEKGLDIQSDALQNCAIDSTELAKESKVVIQEIKRKLDNPDAFSSEKLLELAFDKHRIRRWRMGFEEQVASWSRDDLYNYYKTRYRPQNIIISVVGDIETSKALNLIKKYCEGIPKGDFKTEFSPEEPPQTEFKYRRMTADINRNIIHVGFHVPGVLDDDFYPLTVFDYILSGGRSSRLYREVKEKRGLAESVSSYYYSFKDFGYFTITAEQADGEPGELLKALLTEVERFKISNVGRAELNRALNQLESSYLHSLEDVNGQAQIYAECESYGDYKMVDTYLEKLRAVTVQDIRRVANKYFVLSNASVLEYLPSDKKFKKYSKHELEKDLSDAIENYRQAFRLPLEEIGPVVGTPPVGGKEYPDQPVKKQVLDNGMTVIVKENHSLPIVSTAVYFFGGTFTENADNAGITQLMAKTSLKGTMNMSAEQIAGDIEGLGSTISYEVDRDYFGFRLESMSSNFEESFALFAQVILNPSFTEEEIEKEKKDLIASINRQKDSMGSYPVELCQQALFENHPYGLPSLGDVNAIKKISRADLVNKHRKSVVTGNVVIVFAGDITFDEAIRLAPKHLGRMNVGERLPMPKSEVKLSSIHSKTVRRDRAQSAQAIGILTCSYSSPDYEPLKVLQNVASGMGGRLWTEVRDKRSLAYSVYGYQGSGALAGAFICYIATSPENAEKARELTLEVISGFKDEPVSPDELEMSKNYVRGSWAIYLQTNSTQADLYGRWELSGKGYQAVWEYPEKIRQVSAEQLMNVANKYFDTEYYALGMIEGVGAKVEQRE